MHDQSYHFFKPYFWLGTILIVFGGIYMILQSKKELQDYNRVTGPITMYSQKHPDYSGKNDPKDRYLKIKGYEKAFSLYIGGEAGDFLPEFQTLDKLKLGDTVTVYFNEAPFFLQENEERDKINFFAQQIFQKGQLYYKRGNIDQYLGNFLLITGSLLGCFLFYYKH